MHERAQIEASMMRRGARLAGVAEVAAVIVVLLLASLLGPARASAVTTEPAAGMLEATMARVYVVRSADAEARFLGSAFLWGAAGEVVVTNAHVVGDAAEVRLVDSAGRAAVVPVIARDAVRDVAVLGVAGLPGAGDAGLVAGQAPALGAAVWAFGAPLDAEFTVTRGMVSAAARQVEPAVPLRLLQHDAAVNPGSSGGPLVDASGALVGMNSRIADGSRMFVGIAYAITAADLTRIVTGLIDESLPAFPRLGLRARPVAGLVAAALGMQGTGLLIDEVETAGMAQASGLRAGDVILALNGQVIAEAGDLAFAVEAAQQAMLSGGQADLAVLRGGQALIVMLDLGRVPETQGSLRGAGSGAPARVAQYSLETLGIVLGEGGLVAGVSDQSPALWSGVAEGDRILAVNGAALDAAGLRDLQVRAPVLLLLAAAGGTTRHVLVDPWGKAGGARPVGGANVLDPAVVVF